MHEVVASTLVNMVDHHTPTLGTGEKLLDEEC